MRVSLLLCVCVSMVCGKELPSSFKRCKVSPDLDNKQDQCFKEAVQDAIAQLANGIPSMDVASVDPLSLQKLVIDQGEDSPVAIKLTFTDCQIKGIKNLRIDSWSGKMSSPTDFVVKSSGHTSQIQLAGPYSVNGRVLILPIQGQGQSNLTLENVKATFTMKGEQEIKNGVPHLRLTDFKLNIKSTSRLHIYLENLFNGDKALADNMNVFLNANWVDIWKELRPSINTAFSAVLKDYAKNIMEQVPFDQIFITSE